MFRMDGGGSARKGGAGLTCVVTAALAIVLSGALPGSGQDAGANTSRTDEVAGNPASEPARSAKSGDSFEGPANYTFLVAAGVVCDSSESGGCPAVVKSTNGDGYRLSGAGTFSARGGTAAGAKGRLRMKLRLAYHSRAGGVGTRAVSHVRQLRLGAECDS